MKMQTNRLLEEALAPYATYSEKQMLKAGQLGNCASQILQRRRRDVQRFGGLFLAVIVLQLVTVILTSAGPTSSVITGLYSIVALLQVPTLMELRLSQTRLETLIAMWLLSEHDTQLEPGDETGSLAQLLFLKARKPAAKLPNN